MTGLLTRAAFMDHLLRALARGRRYDWSVAVLAVGLDELPAAVPRSGRDDFDVRADRLQQAVRASDATAAWQVAHLDGDIFVVLCENVGGADGAVVVARRLTSALEELTPSVRVGVTLLDPVEHDDADAVVADAVRALREAERPGPTTYRFSSDPLQADAEERAWRESELVGALERGELTLHYQPIVALDTDRITAVEALLRWQHPQRGQIPPSDFIPLAEKTGLIGDLGAWVLDCACRDAAHWQARHKLRPPLVVAVNLSLNQFSSQLPAVVRAALAEAGLEPEQLRLEITESLVMHDTEGAIAILNELKRMGVLLSVDDFGTGYSSLSYLQRLPVNEVKIDRSFVSTLDSDGHESAIVGAILSLASALDFEVVAEGVETPGQLRALRTLGCDYAQGYFFARPQPATEVDALIAAAAAGGRLPARLESSERRASDLVRERVVIADDADDVLQLAAMSLTTAGFTVHAASSGLEAVDLATTVEPHCVILDLNMPDLSGFEVCRQLRAHPATSDCVILILTVQAAPTDKVEAFSVGADDYIVKPFSPRELVGRVRAALRRKAGEQTA